MAIFVVMSQGDSTALGVSVKKTFEADYFEFENGKWFVTADGLTARDVSQKLGLGEPANLAGVVVTVGGYFGRARADLWEWLVAKTTTVKTDG